MFLSTLVKPGMRKEEVARILGKPTWFYSSHMEVHEFYGVQVYYNGLVRIDRYGESPKREVLAVNYVWKAWLRWGDEDEAP